MNMWMYIFTCELPVLLDEFLGPIERVHDKAIFVFLADLVGHLTVLLGNDGDVGAEAGQAGANNAVGGLEKTRGDERNERGGKW